MNNRRQRKKFFLPFFWTFFVPPASSTGLKPDQHWSLYNICTILVQYMYNCKRTNIVQVLYIYCTTTGVGPLKGWGWGGFLNANYTGCFLNTNHTNWTNYFLNTDCPEGTDIRRWKRHRSITAGRSDLRCLCCTNGTLEECRTVKPMPYVVFPSDRQDFVKWTALRWFAFFCQKGFAI